MKVTVTPLGWQFAVRQDGALVSVHNERREADDAARALKQAT